MKGILLLSGGIDSPVAAYMMGKQGVDLVLVHFDNGSYAGDNEVRKAKALMHQLESILGKKYQKVLVPHESAQTALADNCRKNMQCVLCRRAMLRAAERLAERFEADVIITGESLGQVASQTLANIAAEDGATSLPVLRPLIGLDKLEIERTGKLIGTYEISTMPGTCCSMAPRKPATYSTLDAVHQEECRVDIDALAEDQASRALTIE